MKILVITNLYPPHHIGGYELRCIAAVNALRERGHTVRVLTSDHTVPGVVLPACEPGVFRALRINGYYGHPWLGLPKLVTLEWHNNRTVRQAVAEFNPDIVHVWNLGGISKSVCLTLQQLGTPVVYDVSDHWIARSLEADVWLSWWNRKNPSAPARWARLAMQIFGIRRGLNAFIPTNPVTDIRFPRIYFCSQTLKSLTAAKGYKVEHGEAIYCAVDTQKYFPLGRFSARSCRKLLFVGRLAEDKGVMTALKAMALLPRNSGLQLSVCGHGSPDYVAQLKNFVGEHELPVDFISAPPEQMPEIYRQHDALLFTSEWEEPFALTPLEAMASGLPVIGTTTGGSKELFVHGVNALTYQAGNPAELAHRISLLTGDETLRGAITAAGNHHVQTSYNEDTIYNQMERYLQDSLAAFKFAAA